MKINNKNIFKKVTLSTVFLFVFSTQVFAYYSLPKATGFVNDNAQMLTSQTKQNLENKLSLFEASTTNEITVVTIKSLEGDTVENFAVKLFEEWKIGKAKQDNGILFLISRDDHKMRIEVGYGLEGALPDAKSSRILNQVVTPLFKEGSYDEGILRGVDEIINATKDENYNISGSSSSKSSKGTFDFWVFVIIFASQAVMFIVSILSRSKSWWAGGVIGGVLGGAFMFWFGWTILFGGAITLGLIFFGLLFDYIVSKTYQNSIVSGGYIPWWIGGPRGRGFGSSGGFGGFGGGSSGGGGASGSW